MHFLCEYDKNNEIITFASDDDVSKTLVNFKKNAPPKRNQRKQNDINPFTKVDLHDIYGNRVADVRAKDKQIWLRAN